MIQNSLFIVLVFIIMACNDKPAKPASGATDKHASDSATVVSHNWNEAEKDSALKKCVATVSRQMGEIKATDYCLCMLQKMEEKYPVKDSLKRLKLSEMMKMAKECIK